ncbi:MAG: peptidoglycan editing factor PgeF [Syntrophomonadaceae bacterium]
MYRFTWEKRSGIKYITIPEWKSNGVSIGFSSRWGGVSHEPYNTLNLALHVDDLYNDVMENRKRYLNLFSLNLNNMVCCEQVHGNSVVIVNKDYLGCGAWDLSNVLAGFDAMVCAEPGIGLTTFYADCIPLFFFDPVQRVVAIAHSGWKGTLAGIAGATLKAMQSSFNSYLDNVQVFIGPGIGACCYNIGEELAQMVIRKFPQNKEIIQWNKTRCTWDLKLTNKLILQKNGVNLDKILDCGICTACEADTFFSYRHDKGKTGRMGALIALDY